jgi:hypothetical protein
MKIIFLAPPLLAATGAPNWALGAMAAGAAGPVGGGVASPDGGGGGVLIFGLLKTFQSIVAALDGNTGIMSNVFSDGPNKLDAKAGRKFRISSPKQEKRGSIAAPAPQANQSFYCYNNLCFFLEAVLTCY